MARHISYYLPKLRKQLEKRGVVPEMAIKSIPSLNRKLWGIQRGKFYVIAARTSNGKSAFVMQIAMDLASQGHHVLFLSLEMDTIAVLERALIQTTKINNTDLLHGKIKQYDKQWDDFVSKSKNIELVLSDSIGKTWEEIDQHINQLSVKPKVIIIDHIHEIKKSGQDERGMIDQYLRKFKEMAIRHNFAGILCAQINRTSQSDSKDKRPYLHQIKSSGYLEESADFGILLHYPYQLRLSKDENEFYVYVDKNRNGRTGQIKLKFIPQYYRFEDDDADNQSQDLVPKDNPTQEKKELVEMFNGQVLARKDWDD